MKPRLNAGRTGHSTLVIIAAVGHSGWRTSVSSSYWPELANRGFRDGHWWVCLYGIPCALADVQVLLLTRCCSNTRKWSDRRDRNRRAVQIPIIAWILFPFFFSLIEWILKKNATSVFQLLPHCLAYEYRGDVWWAISCLMLHDHQSVDIISKIVIKVTHYLLCSSRANLSQLYWIFTLNFLLLALERSV